MYSLRVSPLPEKNSGYAPHIWRNFQITVNHCPIPWHIYNAVAQYTILTKINTFSVLADVHDPKRVTSRRLKTFFVHYCTGERHAVSTEV
jgi:hypothetical protein